MNRGPYNGRQSLSLLLLPVLLSVTYHVLVYHHFGTSTSFVITSQLKYANNDIPDYSCTRRSSEPFILPAIDLYSFVNMKFKKKKKNYVVFYWIFGLCGSFTIVLGTEEKTHSWLTFYTVDHLDAGCCWHAKCQHCIVLSCRGIQFPKFDPEHHWHLRHRNSCDIHGRLKASKSLVVVLKRFFLKAFLSSGFKPELEIQPRQRLQWLEHIHDFALLSEYEPSEVTAQNGRNKDCALVSRWY